MKRTQLECLLLCLTGRGERELQPPPNSTRWRVFTRTQFRQNDGTLRPVRNPLMLWFVSKTGRTMRVGYSVRDSIPVSKPNFTALVEEGRICS